MSGDITRGYHGGSPESELANERIEPAKATDRMKIHNFLLIRGDKGATCDEVEYILHMSHQTASARLTELKLLNLAYKTNSRRQTRTGSTAAVICALPRPVKTLSDDLPGSY